MDDRLRVSDADRDRVTGQLRDHFAAGRITPSELDERLSAALTATTFGDLRHIMADLPGPTPAPVRTLQRPPLQGTPAGAARRHRRPLPPLILLALLAALLIPGSGWLLFTFVNVILVFWLTTFMAGALASGRPHRRRHRGYRGSQPRHPPGRHYTWL